MVDLEILRSEKVGSSNERLKEVFTAKPPSTRDKLTPKEAKARQKLCDLRQKWEDKIGNRLNEQIEKNLKDHEIYSAVDLAWNSPPIAKELYPLMLYAQGKISPTRCASSLDGLSCKDKFVSKDDTGKDYVDLPSFVTVAFNLVRSVLTRRVAAQTNKYNNLWPYFKYESRSTSEVGKLRADVISQIADVMADGYGYREHDEEVFRDTMMYAHSIDFVRSAWERERQFKRKATPPGIDSVGLDWDAEVCKEGLSWFNPHPTRTFWDNAYPLKSLNTDTGCKYTGYWDVIRAGDVTDDPQWWNRKTIGFTNGQVSMFQVYQSYFSQYYGTIQPPSMASHTIGDLTDNDRLNQVGRYAGPYEDTAMVICNYFEKIIPKDEGFGNYPFPVWVRFVTAGWNTVIWAEFLPSTPCAVCSYNENSAFQANVSLAHELLSYQDQMSNLLSFLLQSLRADNQKILVLDTDSLTPDQISQFRAQAKGKNFYSETAVLEVSRSKMSDMGFDVDKVIKLIETKSSTAIDVIFRAMLTLMQLMERLLAMSPQEQGQPAPREISATEANTLSGATESVYNHISDAFDTYRAAKKRIIYESYMNFGRQDFRVPVINRYSDATIKAAGLEVFDEDQTVQQGPFVMKAYTVTGTKEKLEHDLIFTSRDGAERSSNMQSAQYLSEVMKSILPIPAVQAALKKGKFCDMVNEIFRMTGAFDIKLEVPIGEEDEPLSGQADTDVLQQLAQIVEQQQQDIGQLKQMFQQFMQQVQAPPGAAATQPPSAALAA